MNIRKKIDEMPRVPILVYVGVAFLAVLGVVWLFAEAKMAFTGSASGDNQVPTLAPVPASANYVDRSSAATMKVEGLGPLDADILLLGGTSTIKGRVVRPGGQTAVQRATVELARWEGERYNAMRITTNFDGTFEVKDLRGGRWSGRGWEPPKYPSSEAAAWFVTEGQEITVDLTTGDEAKKELRVAVSPTETTFEDFVITVVAIDRSVDDAGRLVDLPMNGPVAVSWPFNYEGNATLVLSDGFGTTAGRCVLTNPPVAVPRRGTVRIEADTLEFTAPLCVTRPEPTTTTTTAPPPTITPPSTPTTTTPTTTTIITIEEGR